MSLRAVKSITQSQPTLEGAGVHLRRAFGFGKTSDFDPFLLLDDFRNEHPEDYLAGFPWHPHRGIETITYVLNGSVEHGDSLGNRGTMGAGDVQWKKSRRWRVDMPRLAGVSDSAYFKWTHGLCGRFATLISRQIRNPTQEERARPHAWVPAVGEPAEYAQDDGSTLSGHSREGHSGDRG